jgi:hypothetical protein
LPTGPAPLDIKAQQRTADLKLLKNRELRRFSPAGDADVVDPEAHKDQRGIADAAELPADRQTIQHARQEEADCADLADGTCALPLHAVAARRSRRGTRLTKGRISRPSARSRPAISAVNPLPPCA